MHRPSMLAGSRASPASDRTGPPTADSWQADGRSGRRPGDWLRPGSRRVALGLGCLVAFGLALRVWGIGFGLPYVYHPDEPVHVGQAVGLLRGQTDALSFANPPLYKYLLAGVFAASIGPDRLVAVDPSLLYLAARATSAGLGALTVLAAYWLAWLLRGRRAGLLGAGLAAVTYLLVRESHFAVNDALATLCTTLALAGCVRVARRGARADYAMAGAALGLAAAAKYQAAAVGVPLLLAHAAAHWQASAPGRQSGRGRHVDLFLGLVVALLVMLAAFPPLLTETRRVLGDVWVEIVLPSRLGWEGLDPAGGYVYYLKVLEVGVGWPILMLAAIGVAGALVRREWPALVVASLPLGMYAVMGDSRIYFARYLLPAVPALVALAAIALDDLARPGRLPPVRRAVASRLPLALALLAVGWTLPESLRFDVLLSRVDTRSTARAWIEQHLPAGARVMVEPAFGNPPLSNLPLAVVSPAGRALADGTLDEYRAQGVQYIISSSFVADAPNLDLARDQRRRAFYASLPSQAEELIEVRPSRGAEPPFVYDRIYGPFDALFDFDQPGPTIRVYRLLPAN